MRSLYCILLCLAWLPGLAQISQPSPFPLLDLPPSAWWAGLGGAAYALPSPNPADALFNPALLDSAAYYKVQFEAARYLGGIGYGQLSGATRLKRPQAMLHAGLRYLSFGELQRTDAFGQDQGTFVANQLAVFGGISYQLGPLRVGGNLQLLFGTLDGLNTWALAVDIGALYTFNKGMSRAGLVVQHAGWQLKPLVDTTGTETIPLAIHLSASHKLQGSPFTLSASLLNVETWPLPPPADSSTAALGNLTGRLALGLLAQVSPEVEARMGYNLARRRQLQLQGGSLGLSGWSFGLGVQLGRLQVDYAYSHFQLGLGLHQLGLVLKLRAAP